MSDPRRVAGAEHPVLSSMVERVRGSPLAMANLARTLLEPKGHGAWARALCVEASASGDPEVEAITAEVHSQGIGDWYFSMVRDAARHAAYERTLRRALKEGGLVLDIGAGTGLFAMIAARAGATRVIACERDSAVAEAAREVVRVNAMQDVVEISERASGDLEIGVDIDRPADLLIWDNLANDLIGVGALPVLEDAVRRLVRPGGAVVPARGRIMAALAYHGNFATKRMGRVEGFDLTPFNRLARSHYTISPQSKDLHLCSSAATLFAFDFQSGGPFPSERTVVEVVGTGGTPNGVVQWLEFDLDEEETFSTAPGQDVWAFGLEFHPSAAAGEAESGLSFAIGASHDRQNLRIWREGVSGA